MANKNVIEVNVENFENEVLNSDKPVLVDFWANWCGPCKMLAPVIDDIADEVEGKAKVGKVNIDEQNQLAAKYGIMSIPTVLLFKNGEIVESSLGARPKDYFVNMINNHI